MQLFYSQYITGSEAIFDENDSLHALQVLRLKNDDLIHVTDGKGKLFTGKVSASNKKNMRAVDLRLTREEKAREKNIHLVVSPLKNADAFEWLMEKAVELGVASVTPVVTKNTVKKGVNEKRMQGILLSAMKQSLQLHLPVLNEVTELKKFGFDAPGTRYFFGYCGEMDKTKIQDIDVKTENTVMIIGPEGDFTPEEAELLRSKGCTPVLLGETRLRTETAAMYVLAALKYKLDA